MVDFGFDIKPIFPQPIIRVNSNLLPHTFSGDRRQALETSSKISQIIDRLGELSAVSQKLTKPVTTAQRLRMSENQTIYLLADSNSTKNGQVLGLLKVGSKTLYLFDEQGQTRKIDNAPCILDFYIHDTHQRFGLGKQLFETMLNHEHWLPINCTVDRPSDKLLAFLKKHYGLSQTIPQVNNFVLYEGFFNKDNIKQNSPPERTNGVHHTDCPNSQLFGSYYVNNDNTRSKGERKSEGQSLITQQITQISPSGRYGARRPVCSMAEIIQGGDSVKEAGTALHSPAIHSEHFEMKQELTSCNSLAPDEGDMQMAETSPDDDAKPASAEDDLLVIHNMEAQAEDEQLDNSKPSVDIYVDEFSETKTRKKFHLSKQHTGLKNLSSGVGTALNASTDNNQSHPMPKVGPPLGTDNVNNTPDILNVGLTDRGYSDLKFHHNKLW